MSGEEGRAEPAAGPGPGPGPGRGGAQRGRTRVLRAFRRLHTGPRAAAERAGPGRARVERSGNGKARLSPCSENEELEEIASADLKYLLLPALLGALTLKQVDLSRRLEHLEGARAHFWRFLKLCRSYGLGSFHLPPAGPPGEEDAGSPSPGGPAAAQPSLVAMASSRQAKIER